LRAAPQNARSRRTARNLLKAARELIESGGSEAATMAATAELAGVSRRAIYLHFASRGELMGALVDYLNEVEDSEGAWQAVSQAPDAVSALAAMAEVMADFLPRVMAAARAIRQAAGSDPDAAQHVKIANEWRLRSYLSVMERLRDEGQLSPEWTPRTAAEMLQGIASIEVINILLNECHWAPAELARHLGTLFRRTFVAGDGSGQVTPRVLFHKFLASRRHDTGRCCHRCCRRRAGRPGRTRSRQ
jgi:AcrR family transcriptional regulator